MSGQDADGVGQVGSVSHGNSQDLSADLGLQFFGGAFGDEPAVVDDGDAVGELVGLLEVLGGEEDGGAAAHEVSDDLPEVEATAGVEAGGGLVEEQDLGFGDEAGGYVQAPAHAAGVGADLAIG